MLQTAEAASTINIRTATSYICNGKCRESNILCDIRRYMQLVLLFPVQSPVQGWRESERVRRIKPIILHFLGKQLYYFPFMQKSSPSNIAGTFYWFWFYLCHISFIATSIIIRSLPGSGALVELENM